MARTKLASKNIDNSSPSVYLEGRIKDNKGAGDGTEVNEFIYGDIHQLFAKLMALSGQSYNGLPDNENNGYQLLQAFIALANKNNFVYDIGTSGNILTIPLKLGVLKVNETVVCKATINKGTHTQIRSTVDNTTKAISVIGNFKSGDYVRLINTSSNVTLVRLVDSVNINTAVGENNYLKKATQSQEDTGTTESVATTPKTNKSVFSKRVIGTQSGSYLATATRNGLLSKELWEVLNNLGSNPERNYGAITGYDVRGIGQGGDLARTGDITRAQVTERRQGGDIITCTLRNAMSSTNYVIDIKTESLGSLELNNDHQPIVFKILNTTQFQIYVEETNGAVQSLRIHLTAIQK